MRDGLRRIAAVQLIFEFILRAVERNGDADFGVFALACRKHQHARSQYRRRDDYGKQLACFSDDCLCHNSSCNGIRRTVLPTDAAPWFAFFCKYPLPYYFNFSWLNRQALFSRCGKINANFPRIITNAGSDRCFSAHTAKHHGTARHIDPPSAAYAAKRMPSSDFTRNNLSAEAHKNRTRAVHPAPARLRGRSS